MNQQGGKECGSMFDHKPPLSRRVTRVWCGRRTFSKGTGGVVWGNVVRAYDLNAGGDGPGGARHQSVMTQEGLMAIAAYLSGHPDQGIQAATRATQACPAWRPALESLALCYHAVGDHDEARRIAGQFQKLDRAHGDGSSPLRRFNPQWAEEIDAVLSGLVASAR